ncbi:MAG: bifunctional hydroxymethylpyrimidine kinase/phosphomethylpyrimidine kinase, partial [Paracoccaceae bacterium]
MKGGHLDQKDMHDLLLTERDIESFIRPRIAFKKLHGTGCTMAAAIACGMANGVGLERAVGAAK